MPCNYCGKRVSLVRQITDGEFCCDEHRKRYQDLSRLALDRLMQAGEQISAPRHKAKGRHGVEPETPAFEPPAARPPAPLPSEASFLAPLLPVQRDAVPMSPAGGISVAFRVASAAVDALRFGAAPDRKPRAVSFLIGPAPPAPASEGKPVTRNIAQQSPALRQPRLRTPVLPGIVLAVVRPGAVARLLIAPAARRSMPVVAQSSSFAAGSVPVTFPQFWPTLLADAGADTIPREPTAKLLAPLAVPAAAAARRTTHLASVARIRTAVAIAEPPPMGAIAAPRAPVLRSGIAAAARVPLRAGFALRGAAPTRLPVPSATALPAVPARPPALVLAPYRTAILADTTPVGSDVPVRAIAASPAVDDLALTTVPPVASFAVALRVNTLRGAGLVQLFAPEQPIRGDGASPCLPHRFATACPRATGMRTQLASPPAASGPVTLSSAPATAPGQLAPAAPPTPPAPGYAAGGTLLYLAGAEVLAAPCAAAVYPEPRACAAPIAAAVQAPPKPGIPTTPQYSLARADLARAPAPKPARQHAGVRVARPVQPATASVRIAATAAPSTALQLPAPALRALAVAAGRGQQRCAVAPAPAPSPAAPQRPGAQSVAAQTVLDTAPLEMLAACAAARPAIPAVTGWHAFPHAAEQPRVATAGPGLAPVQWPAPGGRAPRPEPQPDARPSPASRYIPAAAPFEVALRWLSWSEAGEHLSEAAYSPSAPPRVRNDDRATATIAGGAPILGRGVRPAAPALAAAPGYATMPRGAFFYIEAPDCDDEGTSGRGSGKPPALPAGAAWHKPACVLAAARPAPEPFDFKPYRQSTAALEGLRRSAAPLLKTAALTVPMLLASMLVWGAGGDSFRSGMQARAAVRLSADFHEGLEGWFGGRDWARNWVRDPAGFVRVGQLGLYRPSMPMKDYRLEFYGEIDKRQIGWVYRAADLRNYYAMKLEVVQPGPLPALALVRYTIVAGQESQRVQVPIRIVLRNGRAYHFQLNVFGNDFTTLVEKQVVDYWSDDRFKTGGVGFFTDSKDDRPHIYWMKVSYQDDFWGKVCALIAPAN